MPLLILGLNACASAQPMDIEVAQTTLATSWQAGQHIVWEIEWPAMPISGSLTVEIWRVDKRYRFEILETTAPALVGEILIFDGQSFWRYNRFSTVSPTRSPTPRLAPVSELFALIEKLMAMPPVIATHRTVQLGQGLAQQITLTFDDEDRLTFWIDQKTQLPVRIFLSVGQNEASLNARSYEPLLAPPEGLFKPND